MKNLNNKIVNDKVSQQMDLCLNIFNVSLEMMQKLTQNNLQYTKNIMSNSMKLIEPSASQGQKDFLTPLQDVITQAVESNKQLCQDTHMIIAEATTKIKDAVQQQQTSTPPSAFNLFEIWANLTPKVAESFKVFPLSTTMNKMAKHHD